jgi:excisionase family DNA binding protein
MAIENERSVGSKDWRSRAALRIREVADLLGVRPATVRRLVRSGQLPALRLGRILVVPTHALRSRLGELEPAASTPPLAPPATPRAIKVRAARILGELRSGRGARES